MTTSTATLGEIAEFVNGAAFSESDWSDSGMKIIRIQNLTDPTKPFNKTSRPMKDAIVVRPGDLLVSWSATLGVFEWRESENALLNQHIFRVIPDLQRVDKDYLRHVLSVAVSGMGHRTHGATMKHINRAEFLGTQVPLPRLDEQRRIASILDAADALRAKRRQSLEKIDALSTSIFADMFGDRTSMKHGRLGDLVNTTSGGTPNRSQGTFYGGSIPWVKSGELEQRLILNTEEHLTDEGLANSSAKVMPEGTVLLAMYGATIGSVATLGIPAATNQAVCCLQPNEQVQGPFLSGYLQTAKPELIRRAAGGAQPNISQAIIRDLSMPLPSESQQRDFAQRIAEVTEMKDRLVCSLKYFERLFGSLQHQVFQGEL